MYPYTRPPSMRISFAQYRHIRAKYARRAGKAELRGINNRSHPVEQKRPQERSVIVVAQPALVRTSKPSPQPPETATGLTIRQETAKACDNSRRRPSWLLTAYIPGLRFRHSRFFPCRRLAQLRLPSSEPSRPHSPCRHTSCGQQRWFPYRARSRYRPRTAR